MTIPERLKEKDEFIERMRIKYPHDYPKAHVGDRVDTLHGIGTVVDVYEMNGHPYPIVKHDSPPMTYSGTPFSFGELFYHRNQYEIIS